jgi:hypothetical protein
MVMEEPDFEVGQQYENLKGMYEVLAVDGESMRIRWADDGGEVDTTVTQQRRNFEYVLRQQRDRKASSATKRSASLSGYGELFRGLVDADFQDDVAGTHWRSRQQLGGAVTKLVASEHGAFESWSIYHQPQVHWADIGHRGKEDAWLQAKFTCLLNANEMRCGFYIERSEDPAAPGRDWEQFLFWLSERENVLWLHERMQEQNLHIEDLWNREHFPTSLSPSFEGATWMVTRNGETQEKEIQFLPDLLASLPFSFWVNLAICRTFPRERAIALGEQIAVDIAATFNGLTPLYESVAGLV